MAAGLWLACAACSAPSNTPSDGASADSATDSAAVADGAMDSSSAIDSAVAEDSASGSDAASTDGASDASSSSDATSASDGARDGASDGARDGASDGASNADAADASSCNYNPVDEVIVDCGGTYRFVNYLVADPPSATCAPYWQVGTSAPATTYQQAAMNAGCTTECTWRFSMSVTRLYCGVRSGYETLRGTPDRCPTLYRFAEGYFTSVEAHDAMYPCRDR